MKNKSPILLETCPVCTNQSNEVLHSIEQFRVLRCNNCKSVYSNSKTDVIVDNLQDNQKLTDLKISISQYPSFLINRYASKAIASFDFDYLKNHIDLKSIKTSLDIGSKFGFLIKKLLKYNIDAYGIEIIRHPLTVVKGKISYEFFDENYNKTKKYDLITMGDVIYLHPNGIQMLKHTFQMLTNGGHVLVTSFNPNSNLVFDAIGSRGTEHLLYVSDKGYQLIAEQNNCSLVDYSCYIPKFFVLNINTKNKFYSAMILAKHLLGFEKGFKEDVKGLRSYALFKKFES